MLHAACRRGSVIGFRLTLAYVIQSPLLRTLAAIARKSARTDHDWSKSMLSEPFSG